MDLGGPDTRTWVWEQALNIFALAPDFPIVPSREDAIRTTWLTWGTPKHIRGPSNKVPGNLIHAEIMTAYTSYYAVADATEELNTWSTTFFANGDKIVDSLRDDSNTVARQSDFVRASNALSGTAAWLTAQVTPLESWRDKTGHRGDAFQGTGAGAFWTLLDGFAHSCRDLVAQMSRERTSWDGLRDAGDLLKHAAGMFVDGRARWQGGESFTYDTGLGFAVTGTGTQLSTPTGVVQAIWQAPALAADIGSHKADSYFADNVGDNTPASKILGGRFSETGPREKLETAAKKVWRDHLGVADSWGASAVGLLDANYRVAMRYLPELRTPVVLDFSGGNGDGGPGTGDGGTGGGGDGAGPGGGDGSTGDDGTNHTGTSSVPPPPPPIVRTGTNGSGGAVPPPITRVGGGSDTSLKVPSGSHVGGDGTVIGPDGKPVLGPDGRPIIVPPGSRVNGNGEIVGPRGTGNLDQKDRLRKAYPDKVTSGTGGESAMERYLKSLRRTPPAQLPPLRAPDTLPMTMSKFDPQSNFHSGPGSLGAGRVGVAPDASSSLTPPGGKPSAGTGPPTLGGPKGTGTGNGVPFHPPSVGGGAGAGGGSKERDRSTWLAEDEETWGTDPTVAPGVLGRRERRTRRSGGTRSSVNPSRDFTFGFGEGDSTTGRAGTSSG
ncbi:hypothetical protein ACIBCH_19130 [Amycolatopsis thailandensis]|uniref:hypothetical protein n=1 Tax=Amycolatopsis thailandensis TaxID=589330 RepID=UPI003789736C